MDISNSIEKYVGQSEAIRLLEKDDEFRVQEESLVRTLDYLASRYVVVTAYDHITIPTEKYSTDMLFKVSNGIEEIMWVYFQYAPRSKYISIEVDNDAVVEIKSHLAGFVRSNLRKTPNYPSLKLRFYSFNQIEKSLADICDCLDLHTNGSLNNINVPIKPSNKLKRYDGSIQYTCGRCGVVFVKSPRCPECGQLVKE